MVALSKGNDIAVAATIGVTHDTHKVTGNGTTITTINPPSPAFVGKITLLNVDAFQFGTGGNIAKAGGGVDGVAYSFIYDGSIWWPEA